AGDDSRLLESQIEPADVFLELQTFGTSHAFENLSQVQQHALSPDLPGDRERVEANRLAPAVQEPARTLRPWRSPTFERLRDAPTLKLAAPSVVDGSARSVLVGYVDFEQLAASLARVCDAESSVSVQDGAGTVLAGGGASLGAFRSVRRTVTGTTWTVEVRESVARVEAPLRALQKQILWFGALGLVLALVGGSLLASWIARPIARLEVAAKRMSAGDLAARSAVDGNDEIGRLGRAFDHMASEFQKLDSAKSAFAANVSHELRTPLTALRLSVENLLDGVRGPLGDEQRTTLTRVQRDLLRMSKLVDDLLELARLEAGVGTSKRETHELEGLVREAVEPWREIASSRAVRIELFGEGRARVDPALLRRALSNLVDNAVKFSPDGGAVEVEIRGANVTIRDEGPGVGEARVFERFVQGEQHGTKSSGLGLGLSIARQSLHMMGAKIEARDRKDGRNGAVFDVRLEAAHHDDPK
ncbi:MAG TPA: histidine kinase dimerization/phospho-acceptor domain-containing protein, partial [Planctomycetota bacterium]|nr:histidine kinase dimerization/phospho-acceptor domain-containing protein [Planctomycetota bacterium]